MAIERIGEQNIEFQPRMAAEKIIPPDLSDQFEAVFLQSMFKTRCIDQHFTHETSSFITPNEGEAPPILNNEITPVATQAVTPDVKSVKSTLIQGSQSLDQFVKSIWPFARQAARLVGLDPKVLMAQVALETGWGKFIAKDTDGSISHNLFNIKALDADLSVKIKTTEYLTNTPVKMIASFKKYPSVEDGFNDYIALISKDRYKTALTNAHDPDGYISALYQAGYATDPNYASKILSIYHGDELQNALERNGCY